jgi:hypothetical protein
MPNDSKIETDSNDNIVLKLASGETVTVKANDVEFDQDLVPETDGEGELGTPSKSWGAANMEQATIGGVRTSRDTDATFYVDEASGDDTDDGTTAATAFASYERAFEEVGRFTDANVEIRQIGDYNSEVVVQGRSAANQVDTRDATIKIIGDSELDGQSASPSEMESINADLKILASPGVVVEWLHTNGRVWLFGSSPFYLRGCTLGSDGVAFVYNKSSHGTVYNCDFDPQSQDPIIGVFCAAGGVTEIGGGTTFTNWDPNANDFFKTDGGIVLDDDWEGSGGYKESDVGRSGISMPLGGFTLGYPTVDRGLRGKPLREVGGETDASAGDIRAANGASIQARNNADNGDFGITFNSNDELEATASVVPDAAGFRTVGTAATHFDEMHATDFVSHSPEPRDVQAARESLASYIEDGYGSMNVAEMVANLIAVVRTQQQEIEDLRQ